jgi:hypothetical protein
MRGNKKMKKPVYTTFVRLTAVLTVVGVVGLPVAASAATANSSVEATVASVVSVSSSGTVPISVTPTGGGATASASDTVSVDSNNASGYDLTLVDADSTYTMAGFLASDGVTTNGDTLAKTAGTYGSPAALDANSWGWRVDNLGTFGTGGTSTYAGIPATGSAQNIRTTSTTASGEVTTVKYAVKVDTTKKSGIYKDTVTYTATAKP